MSDSSVRDHALRLVRLVLPSRLRSAIVRQQRVHRLQWPRAGAVDFGDLRRLTPISPIFGIERGLPVDRYYIERFLREFAHDVRGHCLEIGDRYYTEMFGGQKVERSDVLHYLEGNPAASIVADLTSAAHIPSDSFDCIIFTQSLQVIYDFRAALRTLHRILRPDGVILITTHGISKVACLPEREGWGEYWHFTSQSLKRILAETFPRSRVEVKVWGNVLAATAFLHGIATEELTGAELEYGDPEFEMIVTARVQKASNG
ncbi:MAG: methyltransferase domain-containing protein [Gemmatimonadota bacterium]